MVGSVAYERRTIRAGSQSFRDRRNPASRCCVCRFRTAPAVVRIFRLRQRATTQGGFNLSRRMGSGRYARSVSQSLDAATLQPADFRVVTRSGAEKVPDCALLEPADDPGESRTVLLIGQFGDWPDNPPTIVRIVDDLLSASGAVNFNGTKVSVASLDAGPYIVVAQTVPVGEWPTNTRGTLCPFGTLQVIRVTWAGGVRRPDRSEVGDAERLLYRVTVRREDGSSNAIAPFALADLGDGDNNHLLCMDTADAATAVSFPAGHLVDPNQDLNPAAYRAVVQKNR